MRKITHHHDGSALNDAIIVEALDDPGPGGACHVYAIDPASYKGERTHQAPAIIHFQKGPVYERGVNGISIESLLAVCIDRLEAFQAGLYACAENEAALIGVRSAMRSLHERTRERLGRQVEGTSQV